MFIHIFTMIWNRKKNNLLIIIEVSIAFTIIFSLTAIGIRNYRLYQEPLGFNYHDMWQVRPNIGTIHAKQHDRNQLKLILNVLKQLPEIKSVQLMSLPVFENAAMQDTSNINGKQITFNLNVMDDGAAETFGIKLLKGRWFGEQDAGQNYNPVIVNQYFNELVFPGENPIGKNIADQQQSSIHTENRIVGVIDDFRQYGEFNQLVPYVIHRYDLVEGTIHREMTNIQIKLMPGTGTAFEKKLISLLKGITPQWRFSIKSWSDQRKARHREIFTPIIIMAIIGSFLIIMVCMGLYGALWQNVTQRTREIGLRRALGATSHGIHRQIISELLLVTILGIVIAFILLLQVPTLGIIPELTWSLFWVSMITSIIFMLILSVLCAYYPGKAATNFVPAEALHYE